MDNILSLMVLITEQVYSYATSQVQCLTQKCLCGKTCDKRGFTPMVSTTMSNSVTAIKCLFYHGGLSVT